MDTCPIVKVKPWGKGQGDYVEINLSEFDPAIHTAVDGGAPAHEAPAELDHEAPPAPAEKPARKPRAKRRRKGK